MATQEERLTNIEETVALLQRQLRDVDVRALDRDVTTIYGMATRQGAEIRDIKISLANLETNMNKRFESLGKTVATIGEIQDKKLSALDSRLSAFEQSVNSRFEEQGNQLKEQGNQLKELKDMLSQVLARLPENP